MVPLWTPPIVTPLRDQQQPARQPPQALGPGRHVVSLHDPALGCQPLHIPLSASAVPLRLTAGLGMHVCVYELLSVETTRVVSIS